MNTTGNIETDPTTINAVISYDGSNIIDLNSVVDLTGNGMVALSQANEINEDSNIVATGYDAGANQHAVYLAAVTLPPAVWQFASGLGMLWMRRR